MSVILIVLVVLIFIVMVLIVTAILLQEDKSGGGIGMIGGSSQSFFGASSNNFLSRATSILFAIFMVLVISAALVSSSNSQEITMKDIKETEAKDYKLTNKNQVINPPVTITIDDFEKIIMVKITNKSDKDIINKYYTKSKDAKTYGFTGNPSKEQKKQILSILYGIGYSQEAKTTTISAVDNTSDASGDKKK